MKNIRDEYNRVCNLSKKLKHNFLKLGKYKDDREIHILGAFVELMELGNYEKPELFNKYNPPEPDFQTYYSDRGFYKNIEIVENMHWSRRRGNEKNKPFDRNKYLDPKQRCKIRLWYSFIKNLNNKFSKQYGKNTWLLMYHNISTFHISDVGFWINIIVGMKNEIEKRGIVDFEKCTYEKIFVLKCDFTELVQIYPENKVIYSEYAQYFIK
jgi:hypothetical protein